MRFRFLPRSVLGLSLVPLRDSRARADTPPTASTLLHSLTSLLSSHSSTRPSSSSSSSSTQDPRPRTPSLLPLRATLRALAPLLLATRTAPGEASYTGTLDPANARAVREGVLSGGTAAVAGVGAVGEMVVGMGEGEGGDLKVEG